MRLTSPAGFCLTIAAAALSLCAPPSLRAQNSLASRAAKVTTPTAQPTGSETLQLIVNRKPPYRAGEEIPFLIKPPLPRGAAVYVFFISGAEAATTKTPAYSTPLSAGAYTVFARVLDAHSQELGSTGRISVVVDPATAKGSSPPIQTTKTQAPGTTKPSPRPVRPLPPSPSSSSPWTVPLIGILILAAIVLVAVKIWPRPIPTFHPRWQDDPRAGSANVRVSCELRFDRNLAAAESRCSPVRLKVAG
jgi:hypothetical protein